MENRISAVSYTHLDVYKRQRIENTKRNMVFGIIFRGVNILFPFINRTAVLYLSLIHISTREDCFGLVLLEAACTGTPIVTSKYADGAYNINYLSAYIL